MVQTEVIETDMMFVQMQEIFKLLDNNLLDKIPEKIKNYITNYQSINNYTFKYDTNKRLVDQQISKDTRRFIAYLDYYYWASNEEKNAIENAWHLNENNGESSQEINSLFSDDNSIPSATNEQNIHSIDETSVDSQSSIESNDRDNYSKISTVDSEKQDSMDNLLNNAEVSNISYSQDLSQENSGENVSQTPIQESPNPVSSNEQNTDLIVKKEGFFSRLFKKLFKRR